MILAFIEEEEEKEEGSREKRKTTMTLGIIISFGEKP